MHEVPHKKQVDWSWRLRLAGTLLSLALLVWLLWKQNWNAILLAIKELPIWIFFLSLGLLFLRHTCNALRWFLLLKAQAIHLRFPKALKLVFMGLFASNFLPSMVGGDVVRIAGILNETDNRIAGGASVIVDRVVGVTGMLFALPFSAPLIQLVISKGLFLGGIVGHTDSKWVNSFKRSVRKILTALRIWLKQPGILLLALIASWMGVISNAIAVLVLAKQMGIPVSLTDVIGATTLVYFITMVPISINGYGLRELAILSFYTHFGATSEQATALALVTRFIYMMVSLPGSFWAGDAFRKSSAAVSVFEGDSE
jgi:uncharacterized membrane protein YbhN (UPF0104 family)